MGRLARIRSRIAIGVAITLPTASLPPPSASAAVTREEVERAIREGVRYLKDEQRADGSWADVDDEARTGTTSLVTLALLTAGEPADSPTIAQGARLPPQVRPRAAQEHLRRRAPDDGLRRRRPRARPARDRRQRRLARGRPRSRPGDRVTWPGSWTYTDFKDPPRRQLEHPVRPARPERRQRGRRPGQARGLGPRPELLGAVPAARRRAGPTRPTPTHLDRQHDLRGDLQPDHHRPEAVPGAGVPRRRPDPELRQGRRSTPTSSAGIDWMASHFRVGENFGNGQQWKYLLPLRPGARRPAHRPAVLRRARLVPRGGRGARPRPGPASTASGEGTLVRATTR